MPSRIPIIDLFAGPGGLGEGFSRVLDSNGERVFDILLSVEKDSIAHRTLSLRAIYRQLSENGTAPDCYYEYLKGNISREEMEKHPSVSKAAALANKEARCAELGGHEQRQINEWVKQSLSSAKEWVLIGGPPCQAYSLVGRSRMRTKNPMEFAKDKRHTLYRQYLRIISDHRPAIFVMENVKGLLSSVHNGGMIFQKILSDLKNPAPSLEYEIRSLTSNVDPDELSPRDFIVRAEDYGVPQMRHRVILLGIRKDLAGRPHKPLSKLDTRTSLEIALAGLPSIRSRISREPDSFANWNKVLEGTERLLGPLNSMKGPDIRLHVRAAIIEAKKLDPGCGAAVLHQPAEYGKHPIQLWYQDSRLEVILGHESRSHMAEDLQRYLFAAAFAKACKCSPKLVDFPRSLLPKHKNLNAEIVPFGDRFKVQTCSTPSSTVVSHISKDGHYYIHPAPAQCRSLTVREAARLQTFPDNYMFEGNRTQQYVQVGNAVPPYLAKQIGEIVADFMGKSGEVTTSFSGL